MNGPQRRLSPASRRVLVALFEAAPEPMYGMEIMDAARVHSGSLYPILARFRDWGWVTHQLEGIDPTVVCRPERTYYRLAGRGLDEARNLLAADATPAVVVV